jgi:hypothetical protein
MGLGTYSIPAIGPLFEVHFISSLECNACLPVLELCLLTYSLITPPLNADTPHF